MLSLVSSRSEYTQEQAQENKYIAYDESLYIAPAMISGMPVVVAEGVQFMGPAFSESSLLALAEKL